MKFYEYMIKRSALPTLESVDAPKLKFKDATEAFALGLDHERKVSTEINKLMDMSIAESDHGTRVMLNWFVTEQLEEESLFESSLNRVKMVQSDARGLLQLDREFGARKPDTSADAGEGA